jgi:hypothetical protein
MLFRTAFPALALPLLVLGCGAHRHLGFEAYGTSAGQRFVCRSGAPACEKSSAEGPIDESPAQTTFFNLPAECKGGVHKILVKNVDTTTPEVIVTCAPDERPAASGAP